MAYNSIAMDEVKSYWSARVTFKSLSETLSFEVSANTKELVGQFLEALNVVLGNKENLKAGVTQRNSPEIQSGILALVEQFKGGFTRDINQIPAFFKKLNDDEYFLFLPFIELNFESSCKIHNYLLSLSSDVSLDELNASFDRLFGTTLTNYGIYNYGSERVFIGERQNRLCRFCNKDSHETTFKNIAHAISEGIGNKKVFLYDECDVCNERFSIEIEPDLINYYSLYRTFYKVKGKKGTKKIKGENYEVDNDEEITIKITSGDSPTYNDKEYNLPTLVNNQIINSQDIYRCLCKFVLSVIDAQYLSSFSETVKWINKEKNLIRLPKIAELTTYSHFTLEPKLTVYIRKTDDFRLPFMVGEFRFTCSIAVFIIPLPDNDKVDFVENVDFDYWWSTFSHYAVSKEWAFNDFSDNKDREFSFSLQFTKNDNAE